MRALRLLPFAALFGLAAWRHASVELELVYLANEGFLARAGAQTLVIDAFVTEPYGPYAAVPRELFADLVAARKPFEDVDLALTSHVHPDHFQAAAAAEFLRARPSTRFLSSPQVVDELRAKLGEGADAQHVAALLPEARATLAAPDGDIHDVDSHDADIHVEFLRLPHSGGARTASVQNLGCVIELGPEAARLRILHVGDADVATEDLAAYELAKRAIDVALVPYWWLGDARSIARAKELTGARRLVAIHVPPGELADVKQRLASLDPALIVFEKPGEARTLALER